MKKKILVTVLIAALILATPLIGVALAGYGGKNVAAFQWEVQVWGLNQGDPPHEDTRLKTIEKEEGNMIVGKNIHTIGEYPLVDFNLPFSPTWDDYPDGGIRLIVTPEGEDPYTLVGTFEKTLLWIVWVPKGGMFENARWRFTITGYEGDTVPPDGYLDSTMYGTLKSMQGSTELVIKSTKGTGIFEGAFLRGTHTTVGGLVFNPSPPPVYTIFSHSTGSGEIVFP